MNRGKNNKLACKMTWALYSASVLFKRSDGLLLPGTGVAYEVNISGLWLFSTLFLPQNQQFGTKQI